MKYAIRSMFIPRPGYSFLAMDFSAAESWVVAYLSKSQNFKDALTSGDFHSTTAAFLFDKPIEDITKGERYIGKKCNHGLSYRMGPFLLAESINDEASSTGVSVSRSRAKYYHGKWHELYQLQSWWNEIDQALISTRTLITPYGRKRTFMGLLGESLRKEATAFVPQSTVGEHCLGRVQKELGIRGGILGVRELLLRTNDIDAKIVHTAYDSAMWEVQTSQLDYAASCIYPLMRRPIIINHEEITIPVDIEVGVRWGELKKYKLN